MKFNLREEEAEVTSASQPKEKKEPNIVEQAEIVWKRIRKMLREKGHGKYADLLAKFNIILTNDFRVAAFTDLNQDYRIRRGLIALNRNIKGPEGFYAYAEVLVRHELLHNYMFHHKRELMHLARESNPNISKLDEIEKDALELLKANSRAYGDINNILQDWEISQFYTDEDIQILSSMKLGDREYGALAVSVDQPEFINTKFEKMWDEYRTRSNPIVGTYVDEHTFLNWEGKPIDFEANYKKWNKANSKVKLNKQIFHGIDD